MIKELLASVTDSDTRYKLRTDETFFRIAAPREVEAIGIVQLGQFSPGGMGLYASATVIGVRIRPAFGRQPAHRTYSLHRLAYADDRLPESGNQWYLFSGHYDIPTLALAQLKLADYEACNVW